MLLVVDSSIPREEFGRQTRAHVNLLPTDRLDLDLRQRDHDLAAAPVHGHVLVVLDSARLVLVDLLPEHI